MAKPYYPIWEVEVTGTSGKKVLLRASTKQGYTAIIRALSKIIKITVLQFLRTGSN